MANKKREYYIRGDNADGLGINRIIRAPHCGIQHYRISLYERDNLVTYEGGKFTKVGVNKEVRRVNRLRFKKINEYKRYINGETV